MLINKRLILCAFLARLHRVRRGAGARRLADVRPQPAQCLALQSGILLSLGHRARLGDGLCIPDPDRDGLWLCDHGSGAGKAAGRPPLGLGRLFPGRRRRRGGDDPGLAGLGLGALHLLSADGRQSLLLHRRRDGRGRLMDLGRADVDQSGDLEARQSRTSPCRWRCSPMSRAPISGAGPRSAPRSRSSSRSCRWRSACDRPSTPGWRACSSPGRCMRSSISG